ncbi:MAG: CHAD domain-containing protein [Geminicoccaceae bacterium]|nr:CHAD domain-containing protein [Geminicoccaceae bacterium]
MVDHCTSQEIELKLLLDPRKATKLDLNELPILSDKSDIRRQSLETTYYDTDDGRLRQRRMALRVRRVGKHYLQTLKTAGSGGVLSVRGEWEVALDGPDPDMTRIGDAKALDRLGLVLPEQIKPVFTTMFERQKAIWSDGSNKVEIALDVGRIDANDKSLPVAEIELELKGGHSRAIFSLVEEIRDWVPVRIGTEPKAERGYRLCHDQPPAWSKRQSLHFEKDISLRDGIRTILRDCLTTWLDNEPAAIDGRDSEGVHQLRIAIRRMRSALVLFAPWMDEAGLRTLAPRLQTALKALGPAREIDVFVEELLEPYWNDLVVHADLTGLLDVAARARMEAHADLRHYLTSRDHADLVLDLVAWIELDRWKAPHVSGRLVTVAEVLLDKRLKKLLKRGRRIERLSDEERHELRLALKKLRYATDFLSPLFPGRKVKKGRKLLASLQDSMGQANDLAECSDRIDSLLARNDLGEDRFEIVRSAGFLHGWHACALAVSRAELDEAWRAFAESKPFWK